jgi:hypothetical protein
MVHRCSSRALVALQKAHVVPWYLVENRPLARTCSFGGGFFKREDWEPIVDLR